MIGLKKSVLLVGLILSSLITLPAGAVVPKGQAKLVPVENAILHQVKAALLNRVEAGVFQLQMGKSMDLTEHKVLLTFRSFYGSKRSKVDKKIVIMVNGKTEYVLPGDRLNLLRHKASSASLEGYSECFLDYVELMTPKGVPATATFRLHCE